MTDEEESRYSFFRESALGAYDRGDFLQSLHQANQALELDDGDPIVHLVKGFCQLKLGKAASNPVMSDEEIATCRRVADAKPE